MPIQVQGFEGNVAGVDGTAFRALRIVSKPIDHGVLGHYSCGLFTGILPAALAAGSEIFQFRWVDGTRLAMIRRITISASVSTTMFAVGVPVQVDLVKATGWTGQGTGGTGLTLGAALKTRTSMGSSLLGAGDVRIATTAALGAGTKSLEATPLSAICSGGPITASLNGTIFQPNTELWVAQIGDGDHPLILAANEGIVVRSAAVPGTGTWTVGIRIQWAELTAF